MGKSHLMTAVLHFGQCPFDNKLCSQGWAKTAPVQTLCKFLVIDFRFYLEKCFQSRVPKGSANGVPVARDANRGCDRDLNLGP